MKRASLEALAQARRDGRPMVRAVDSVSGDEMVIDPSTDGSALGLAAAAAVARDASGNVTVDGRDWFLTLYNVPLELVIIGAVHIAQALAQIALAAGYRVRVIDPRPAYAAEERFPGVRLIKEWADDALAAEPLTSRSAVIALAHDPKIDDPALLIGLRSPAFYVGALGSDRTHGRRLVRLAAAGYSPEELARIHGPVGIAIGARTPGEIAIAVLAELVQVRRDAKKASRIGGVVLAAGLGSRMNGENKMTADLNGKPLVRHAVEAAFKGGLSPVIVVTGHEPDMVAAACKGLDVVFAHNPDYAGGLSGSVKRGIAALPPSARGAMILLGDMPDISPHLITRLTASFDPAQRRAIMVATSNGKQGHPVLWSREFFPELAELSGDAGAKEVMARHASVIARIEAGDGTPLADIDTPDALKARAAKAV